MQTRIHTILGLLAFAVIVAACSTKRDKWINRTWHSVNTRYNGYYYGNLAIEEAFVELAKANKDNYNSVIQVYQYGDKNTAQAVNPLSDRTLLKGTNMVKKHSMLINGKQKNKWIDDCYLFMGKANFIKRDYSSALQQFQYVMQSSEKESTKEIARLWMIKTYQDMGEFGQAESEFNNVVTDKLPKRTGMRDYHAAMADFFIKSEDYIPAIIPLQELIKITKKKSKLARYNFILGQIYRLMGEKEQARKYFSLAVKLKPEYELEFQSAIALALTAESDGNNEDLRKKLRNLLRDDNNIDFQDQIYYAIAILNEREGQRDRAIANYKKSVATSTTNREQKGISYLALAEFYFGERQFVPAQAYYDSASSNLDKKHPRFAQVNALKENLGAIVDNINIINTEDSLQNLVRMPEKERLKKIEDYIDKLRKADEERIAAEENPNALVNSVAGGATPNTGKWYFQNPQTIAFGVKEFAKLWGSRKNEDNWRRKNKAMVIGDPGQTMVDPEVLKQQERDKLEATRYNPQTYIDMLPFGDSALAASSAAIYEASYNLGLLYKQNLQAYDRSIESFTDLEKRNTDNKFFPETYYQLYVLYGLTKNTEKADEYKNIILNQYPQSEFARIISDPDYLKRKEQDEKGADVYYAETFSLFKAKNYPAVSDNYAQALVRYKGSEALPKFALLSAISKGYLLGREDYIRELGRVDSLYPGTPQGTEAHRMVDILNSIVPGVDGSAPQPSTETFVKANPSDIHYMVINIPDVVADLTKTRNAIGNFNSEFYSTMSINAQEMLFDAEKKFLVVKQFESADKALIYANSLDKNSEILEKIPTEEICTYFVISQKNFVTLMKNKELAEYMKFYFENYKPQ